MLRSFPVIRVSTDERKGGTMHVTNKYVLAQIEHKSKKCIKEMKKKELELTRVDSVIERNCS